MSLQLPEDFSKLKIDDTKTEKDEQTDHPEKDNDNNNNNNNNNNDTTPQNEQDEPPTKSKKRDWSHLKNCVEDSSADVAWYDVETTIPNDDMIEFGVLVLSKEGWFTKGSYQTLIYSEKISKRSIECNGITSEMVQTAPKFKDVADIIYAMMNNKIWAGHNIIGFDNDVLCNEFDKIGKEPPKCLGIIDTLPILREHYGNRAGNLKMASLGAMFGLGIEKHRAIEDSQMTIDAFKNCCTTLFLEKIIPGFANDKVLEIAKTPIKRTPKASAKTPSGSQSSSSRSSSAAATPMPEPSADHQKQMALRLQEAISKKQALWLLYNNGSAPRHIENIKWEKKDEKFRAVDRGVEKSFLLKKVLDLSENEMLFEPQAAVVLPAPITPLKGVKEQPAAEPKETSSSQTSSSNDPSLN